MKWVWCNDGGDGAAIEAGCPFVSARQTNGYFDILYFPINNQSIHWPIK